MLNKQITFTKELLLTPLFLIFTLQCVSQYFNDTISTPFQHEQTIAFDYSGEFLTSAGIMSDSSWSQTGLNSIHFKQYDENYNVIRQTLYQDSTNAYGNSNDLCYLDNYYYFSGSKSGPYFQGNDTSYVIKFDSIGNIVWMKNYFFNVPNSKINYLESSGDDIVIAGIFNYEPDSVVQYSFIAKIDSSGSMIWNKTFDEYENSAVVDFTLLNSNDIIINLGFEDGPQNFKTKIYKINTNGNIIWSNTFGVNGPWLKSIFSTIELNNGSLLCYGGISDPDGADFERSWLLKLDSNGNLITDTIYKFSLNSDYFETSYSKPKITSDEVFLLGHYREDGAAQKQSYLASIDFDLNLNWIKIHGNYLRRNEITFLHSFNNGYYLMSGYVYNENTSSPKIDEWFMVVDSLGCDVADCSLGLDELEKNKVGFTISPNPSSSFVKIQLKKTFNYNDEMEYQLIDSFGRLLKKANLRDGEIDVSKLQSGMYYIRVMTDSLNLGTQRLIVK